MASDSTGGGTFRLLEINGFKTDIVGDCYEVLVFFSGTEQDGYKLLRQIEEVFKVNEGTSIDIKNDKGLINIKRRIIKRT